jgi:hypothetical protein
MLLYEVVNAKDVVFKTFDFDKEWPVNELCTVT